MTIFHATPYDISASGFYFETWEEYQEKAAKHKNEYGWPVEEYEIQFIDGDGCGLFNALEINQASLKDWFDRWADLDDDTATRVRILLDHYGMDSDAALEHADDLQLFEGTPVEYAEQLVDDTGMLDGAPEELKRYFDYEAFARDLLAGGDIAEIDIAGKRYIATGV